MSAISLKVGTIEKTTDELTEIASAQQARAKNELEFKGSGYQFLAKTKELKDIMQAMDDLWGGISAKEAELITKVKKDLIAQDEENSRHTVRSQYE